MATSRFRPWMLVSAAWIGPAVLAGVNEVAQRRLSGDRVDVASLLFEIGDWLLYAFLTPGIFALARRWPLARPQLARRITFHLGMALLFCAAWSGAGTVLRALLVERQFDPEQIGYFVRWFFVTLPFGVAVYFAVVGIEHATRYFEDARAKEVQVARLSEQLASARFSALQAQLNPHFLFNTLNTIAVLVREGNQAGATQMVEQLGEMLRRTLTRHRTNEVALDEELVLVRQYLAIEQVRFSDRLRPEIAIDPGLGEAAVPGFALQHLVENAVRHGIAKRTGAGLVRVTARRDGDALVMTVEDDGAGLAGEPPDRPGHGLHDTRERLRALYGDRASLVVEPGPSGGAVATFRLPYRTLPRGG